MVAQRFDGYIEQIWDHAASVGKRTVTNGIPWYRGSRPVGYYRMCGYTYNTISYYQHYFCTNWLWVP